MHSRTPFTIRRANKIAATAKFDHLEIEDWVQSGFFVHYDNGQTAEVFLVVHPRAPAEDFETVSRERIRLACWFRRLAETNSLPNE